MIKSLAALGLLFGTAVSAQSVSYSTNNPSRLVGDPNKVVCEKTRSALAWEARGCAIRWRSGTRSTTACAKMRNAFRPEHGGCAAMAATHAAPTAFRLATWPGALAAHTS